MQLRLVNLTTAATAVIGTIANGVAPAAVNLAGAVLAFAAGDRLALEISHNGASAAMTMGATIELMP